MRAGICPCFRPDLTQFLHSFDGRLRPIGEASVALWLVVASVCVRTPIHGSICQAYAIERRRLWKRNEWSACSRTAVIRLSGFLGSSNCPAERRFYGKRDAASCWSLWQGDRCLLCSRDY